VLTMLINYTFSLKKNYKINVSFFGKMEKTKHLFLYNVLIDLINECMIRYDKKYCVSKNSFQFLRCPHSFNNGLKFLDLQ